MGVATWETDPFPHAVIDGLWDDADLQAAASEFPPGTDPRWITYGGEEERGKMCGAENMQGPAVRRMLARMKNATPLLEELTGIRSLVADTLGGGMHMTGEGGRLAVHRDFNVHPSTGLERRLNLLVFLNPQWDKSWGGVLYLGEHREIEILPLSNRTAIFECGPASWHGHPEPITGGHWRKSLACYFYAPPRGPIRPDSTVWL